MEGYRVENISKAINFLFPGFQDDKPAYRLRGGDFLIPVVNAANYGIRNGLATVLGDTRSDLNSREFLKGVGFILIHNVAFFSLIATGLETLAK